MIFLPIKPKYVSKILSGEKKVEFRKSNFSKNTDNLCIIYSSYPVKKIVGYFEYKLDTINKNIVFQKYGNIGGINKKELEEYYINKEYSNVLIIKKLYKIKEIQVDEIFESFKVPQSFCYISEEEHPSFNLHQFKVLHKKL